MNPSEFVKLSQVEDEHWWFIGMKSIMARILERLERPRMTQRILDAGCGTGGALAWLDKLDEAYGIDRHSPAVALAQRRDQPRIARATVEGLPFAEATFDLVTSFDVLYHVDVSEDVAALREFARVLVPGGLLLLRLPALEWLGGSPHDRAVHTKHRYTCSEIAHKLQAARMRSVRVTYVNTTLFLPAMLWRLFQRAVGASKSSDVRLPAPLINRVCTALLRIEAIALDFVNFPIGLSVLAIARKDAE